jgi:hypothetical protein
MFFFLVLLINLSFAIKHICSNVTLVDDNIIVNSKSSECFKSCISKTTSCYYISGVTYCFPLLRNSNSFLDENKYNEYHLIKKYQSFKVGNDTITNFTVVNTSIFFPGTPSYDDNIQILYNGQWLTDKQWKRVNVELCYINYSHKISKNYHTTVGERDFFNLRANKGSLTNKKIRPKNKRVVNQDGCEGNIIPFVLSSGAITSNVSSCGPAACYAQMFRIDGGNTVIHNISFKMASIGTNIKPISITISKSTNRYGFGSMICTTTIFSNIGSSMVDVVFPFAYNECIISTGYYYIGVSGAFSAACAGNTLQIGLSPSSSISIQNTTYGNFSDFNIVTSTSDNYCTLMTTIVADLNDTVFTDLTISSCAATESPTTSPTNAPTSSPTTSPTPLPTSSPTKSPTSSPTSSPTISPTSSPTTSPTTAPSSSPTSSPTVSPTGAPTIGPSQAIAVQLFDSNTPTAPPPRKRDNNDLLLEQNLLQCDPIFETLKNRSMNISFGAPERCIGQTFKTSNVTIYVNTISVLVLSATPINVRPMELAIFWLGPNAIPNNVVVYTICLATSYALLTPNVPTVVDFQFSNCPFLPDVYYSFSFSCALNGNCLTTPVFLFQEDQTAISINGAAYARPLTELHIVRDQGPANCFSGIHNYTIINDNVFSGLTIQGCVNDISLPTKYPTYEIIEVIDNSTGQIPDLDLRDVDVYVAWTQPSISIITSVLYGLDVWFTKPGLNFLYQCNGSCELTVPDEFYLTEGNFVLFVYDNASLIYQNSYPVNPYVSCPIPTNPISPIWAQSWACFGVLGRFLLVSACLGLVLMMIMAIGLLVFIIYIIIYCIQNRNSATVINNITMASGNARDATVNTIDAIPHWAQALLAKRVNATDLALIILVLPMLLGGVGAVGFNQCGNTSTPLILQQSCQYTFSISGKDLVCSGGICDINFNYQATFALLGQTVCLNFIDPNGNVVTTLQLTYQYQIRAVQLVYSYTTYSWAPFSTSYKGCPSTNTCPISGCPSPPTVQNPSANNDVFNNYAIATFPTILNTSYLNSFPVTPNLECAASCGCAGCGCFFCNSGCMWTYFKMVPTGDEFYVFYPTIQYSYPVLNGMFYRPGANCYDSLVNINFKSSSFSSIGAKSAFSQATLSVSSTASTSGQTSPYIVNFVLLSSVVNENLNFGSKNVICNMRTGNCFLGVASPPNGPTAGIVGDIQYSVDSKINQVWNPASVIISYQQNSASFAFPPIGARFVDGTGTVPYPVFPMQLGDTIYEIVNFNLGGLDHKPGPLTIGINTLVNFQVSYTDTTICPSIILNGSAAGCSSCLLGATIKIDVISTCSSGYAFVSLEGPGTIGTGSIFLDTVTTTEIITFFPNNETGTFTLTVFYKTFSSKVIFSGFFQKMAELDNGTWIVQNNASNAVSSNNITGLWDSLSLNMKIGIGFSIGIGSIILISVVGIIIGIISYKIYQRTGYRQI